MFAGQLTPICNILNLLIILLVVVSLVLLTAKEKLLWFQNHLVSRGLSSQTLLEHTPLDTFNSIINQSLKTK